ncbi:alpha/beta fold hydrolase [Marinobacter mobilis]|uniref:Pimeloyl-ACP methyl ester carboxylesterase n=1 Tax=Marinobacter mobilis TaxID=488533 RepID=A0A1H2SCA3_9GAMM|nr:alpha/beta hydrolase [Marinobacter mobilis]SDW29220.1 Pimeloyl-ACP methyl ester carboxylesterase [Marinobacter mobilis]
MKRFIGLSLVLVLILAAVVVLIPTRVGDFIYTNGALAEAYLYGLEQDQVDIGEMSLTVFDNKLEGRDTLILIHGYTANKNVWIRFARAFTDEYRVVIPDLAGHGDTGFSPDWDYSIAAQSERIAKLMAALNIDSAHIVGNSMGGFIAADFAINYPAETKTVTLFDPAGLHSPVPSEADTLRAEGRNPFLPSTPAEFEHFYGMTMEQPPYLPGIVLDTVEIGYIQNRDRHRQIFEEFYPRELTTEELQRVSAPALLVWGANDRIIHVSAAQLWKEKLPGIEVDILDGIGHMPMVESPTSTAMRYQIFLNAAPTERQVSQ